ncbi:hypothetical protein LIER_35564 [Lithospermum erythrorhizon]|uniref:Uncharacterized protein n=1 Tax=Lithospermum erythrorhizon TaxID=34254 RepID=A0AAV3NU79_LITER
MCRMKEDLEAKFEEKVEALEGERRKEKEEMEARMQKDKDEMEERFENMRKMMYDMLSRGGFDSYGYFLIKGPPAAISVAQLNLFFP